MTLLPGSCFCDARPLWTVNIVISYIILFSMTTALFFFKLLPMVTIFNARFAMLVIIFENLLNDLLTWTLYVAGIVAPQWRLGLGEAAVQ